MKDLIERQAAIDVVLQAVKKTPSQSYCSVDEMMGYRTALQLIYHELKAISPAQQSSSCNHEKDAEQLEPEEPFEKCSDCIHADDSEDMCILRRCKHAIAETVECFEPKQPDEEKISDALYNIYRNKGTSTSAEGVAAIKYYIAEIWREIYGEEGPVWMKK